MIENHAMFTKHITLNSHQCISGIWVNMGAHDDTMSVEKCSLSVTVVSERNAFLYSQEVQQETHKKGKYVCYLSSSFNPMQRFCSKLQVSTFFCYSEDYI